MECVAFHACITLQQHVRMTYARDLWYHCDNQKRSVQSTSLATYLNASMPSSGMKIRDVTPTITTFSTPFNRFMPFGYRNFVAVGNRVKALRLHDNRILLPNPIQFEQAVRDKLNQLGGVHLVASDFGHHMYVKDYVDAWSEAKTVSVPGLVTRRKDLKWDYIYKDWRTSPDDQLDFLQDMETVLFEGFITYCVAWYHRPTETLIQSDLLTNLPCTEVCLRARPLYHTMNQHITRTLSVAK